MTRTIHARIERFSELEKSVEGRESASCSRANEPVWVRSYGWWRAGRVVRTRFKTSPRARVFWALVEYLQRDGHVRTLKEKLDQTGPMVVKPRYTSDLRSLDVLR